MNNGLAIGAVALGGVGAYLLFGGKASAKKARPVSAPPNDVEFGEAPFPPPDSGAQWDRLRALATTAEQQTRMRGLAQYLVATAKGESNGNPDAMNTVTDGPPALDLFCQSQNFESRYRDNPWRPARCGPGEPGTERWAYSGGLFQLMPASALATSDKRAHLHDPARVFDPPFAVAYATDMVKRLKTNYGAQTWGDIRAGWAMPKWATPSSSASGKAEVIARFRERLQEVGASPSLADQTFTTSKYPGFRQVLHALMAADRGGTIA